MNLKHEIVIWWSDEDDAFIVDVPEIPGCTAHGPTYADAAREIQVAMSLWIDTCEEFGMEIHMPPEPMGERLQFSYIWHQDEKQAELGISRKHEMVIYWSDAGETYTAEVPAIPGCAADGRTYNEAVAKAQAVMEEWIEASRNNGREIHKPSVLARFA